jgi:hypothetical protein
MWLCVRARDARCCVQDTHLLRKGELGIPVIVEDIIAYLTSRALDT